MTKKPTRTKTFGFGGCTFARTSPKRDALDASTPMLNIAMSFEDALKLSLAIDECIRRLNSYNRATRAGKRSGLNLAVHLNKGRITINEATLDP
jgi:hypothetical protein